MNGALNSCEPKAVFSYFEKITEIPHGSHHEEKLAAFLVSFAKEHGLSCREDEAHNVLIRKPASSGYETEPPILLQGHLDMVCEKRADSAHDFLTQPLSVFVEDGWIRADGTTLGADNGIAVAMILAILEDGSLKHPALECLFTVQEETSLTGAAVFDYSDITARTMINLDSEEEDVVTVSCAGGIRCDFTKPVLRVPSDASRFYEIAVTGLAGGHSGMEIGLGRANAIRSLAVLLTDLAANVPLSLYSIDGGAMDNAIPRDAKAVIGVSAEDTDLFLEKITELAAKRHTAFVREDLNAKITADPTAAPVYPPLCKADASAVLSMIVLAPNGVLRRDGERIETSANLGVVRTEPETFYMTSSARSSADARKDDVVTAFSRLAAICGATLKKRGDYPGWAYAEESAIREKYCRVYRAQNGKDPVIASIHAGLECGIFCARLPGLDAISVGPDMRDVHTPGERLSAASTARIYRTVCALLSER